MKLHMVFCLVLTAVSVPTLSIPTNDHGTPSSTIPAEQMEERLAILPAILMMSEEIVSLGDHNMCMEKLGCLLENNLSEIANNSFYYLSKYLTNKHHDLDDASFARVRMLLRNYPRMGRLVDAITLAQSHSDPEICSVTFPECRLSAEGLISASKIFDNDAKLSNERLESGPRPLGQTSEIGHRERRKIDRRDGCILAKTLCYSWGLGCGICAVFTAGFCGFVCVPASAVPCGFELECDINGY